MHRGDRDEVVRGTGVELEGELNVGQVAAAGHSEIVTHSASLLLHWAGSSLLLHLGMVSLRVAGHGQLGQTERPQRELPVCAGDRTLS